MSTRGAGIRWLWLLVAAGVLTQGALNLLRPITTYKVLALGGDAGTVGLVTAAYALLPLFMAMRLGRLTDRTPHLLRLIVVAAGVLGLGGAVLALAPTLWLTTVGSVLLGMGHLLFTISGQAAIARHSPDAELDRGFGWFTASYSLGQTIGPVLGGLIVGAGATTDRLASINLALWAGAGLALLAAPLMLLSRVAPDRTARHEGASGPRPSMIQVLRIPGVASNMAASMGLLATMDVLTAFFPLVGEHAGISPTIVGWLLAVRGAAGIFSRVGLSGLSRRYDREHLLITSVVASGLILALTPLSVHTIWLCAMFMAIGGYFLGLGQPLTMSMISTSVPADQRSAALAIRLMGNRVAQVAFPSVAGLVAGTVGPAAAIWVACGALVLSGAEKIRGAG